MEIRPWSDGDVDLVAATSAHLSPTTLYRRFMAGTGNGLPPWYLRHLAAGPRPTWDAEVAADSGLLVGWAEFGRLATDLTVADLSIVVADPWQRQGVGTALVRAMLPRCVDAGVRVLRADVLPSNRAARGLLSKLFPTGMTASFLDGAMHFEVALDQHPVTMHRSGALALAFAFV